MQDKEVDQRRSGFWLFTFEVPRGHDGHDGGACAIMDPGKSPEKEPVLCHCTDQPRRGEHRTQEARGGNGDTCEDVMKQERPGHLLPRLHGAKCISLLSLNHKGRDTGAYDSRRGENQDTDLDVRAQRVPTITTYLAASQPTWRKACGKGLSG